MIALPKLEVHDALLAVVGRPLEERDDIRTASGGGQQLGDVGLGDVVVIIHERDVLPARDVEQCLPLRANAAGAVVTQDQMLDLPRSPQRGTPILDVGW